MNITTSTVPAVSTAYCRRGGKEGHIPAFHSPEKKKNNVTIEWMNDKFNCYQGRSYRSSEPVQLTKNKRTGCVVGQCCLRAGQGGEERNTYVEVGWGQ